jgi:hypothetical protein
MSTESYRYKAVYLASESELEQMFRKPKLFGKLTTVKE